MIYINFHKQTIFRNLNRYNIILMISFSEIVFYGNHACMNELAIILIATVIHFQSSVSV